MGAMVAAGLAAGSLQAAVCAAVACPECAQQPGEWCATWDQYAGGMVERNGLVHPMRVEAAEVKREAEAGLREGAVHVANEATIAAAADRLV